MQTNINILLIAATISGLLMGAFFALSYKTAAIWTLFVGLVLLSLATCLYLQNSVWNASEPMQAEAAGTIQSKPTNKTQKPQITNFHAEGNSGDGIHIVGMDVDINGGSAKNNGGEGLRIEKSKSNLPKKKRGKQR